MTTQTPAMPRLVLLIKAIKPSLAAGFALYGSPARWHKVHKDKPAPHGAPVLSAVPEGEQLHEPDKMLTPEMWSQIFDHPANTNQATFHKKLDKLKEAFEAGDADAILAGNYPADTTHKKLAKVGNYLLGLLGSEHTIAIGQKKGEHPGVGKAAEPVAAVVAAPVEPVAQAVQHEQANLEAQQAADAPPIVEPVAVSATTLAMPEFVEGKTTTGVVDYYQEQAQKVIDMAAAGDTVGLVEMKAQGLKPNGKGKVSNTWAGKTANSKLLMALHDDALGQALDATDNEAPGAVFVPDPEPIAAEPVAVAQAAEPVTPVAKLHSDIASVGSDSSAQEIAFGYLKEQGSTPETVSNVISALKAAGFNGSAAAFQNAQDMAAEAAAQKVDQGPKEGDTKDGADGMLVLKDGHWVKVESAAPTGKKLKASEAIALGKGLKTSAGFKAKLKTMAVAGDVAGLQAFIEQHPNLPASKKYASNLINAMTDGEGVQAAAAPAPTPAPPPAAPYQPGVESMDSWKQTGPQGGSNPGGKFVDDQGVEWYCKFPGDDDVAKSEVLAAKLYAAAGVAGQDAKLISKDGKLGIASKWTEVSKLTPAQLAKADGVASGFAVDAWLGNWDVVGMGYDNLQVGPDGKAVRIDAGGSLEYRAQGGKKAFGPHVVEIDSLRDAKINHQSSAVFGKMSTADVTASVSKVLGVSDAKIHALVHAYGPGDAAAKQKMIDTLIARKADLAEKFPKAKKEKKAKVFNSDAISSPPSFMNWGGSGKSGPSSKEFLNAANESAVQSIYEAAKTGSIEAVQALSAAIYNKESGDVSGSAPVLDHPSQHVKGYAQQAINELNYQLHPPKRFRFEGGHPLHSLNSAYPSHKGPLHSAISKVGKFILLGEPGTISLDTLALPKHTYQSGAITTATFSPAAKAAIKSMPETQKQAIKAYTGSSYHAMNTSLWSGNPSGAAKSAGEALHALGHDITPGTVLSRKISVSGADLDQILKSTGKVLQEPAIMSTSIRPSSWSGNVQLKMHVGPGVKGLWVGKGSVGSNGALSNHSGEDELILPPNTRLLILSVKKTTGADADGFGGSSQHVIEAVILPTQASA